MEALLYSMGQSHYPMVIYKVLPDASCFSGFAQLNGSPSLTFIHGIPMTMPFLAGQLSGRTPVLLFIVHPLP